jgi:hypothetical protein
LYVSNEWSNSVSKITPSWTSSVFASTGSQPQGLTFDANGDLYVVNRWSNNISKITPDWASSIFVSVGDSPHDLTFDANGNLYVANSWSDNISKITISQVTRWIRQYSTTNPDYIGVVKDDVTLNDTANVIVSGVVDGFIWLTPWYQYKAKPTWDIEVTTTAIEVIWRAISETKLLLS